MVEEASRLKKVHTVPSLNSTAWLKRYGCEALDSVLLGVILLDTHGICRFANARALELLQRKWSSIQNSSLHDLVCAAPQRGTNHIEQACVFSQSLRTGRVRSRRIQTMYRADGEPIWIEYSTAPLREKKQIVGCIFSFADASKTLRTRKEFSETQALFKAVFDAHSDALFIITEQQVIIQANPTAVSMFGQIKFGRTILAELIDSHNNEKLYRQLVRALKRRKPKPVTIQVRSNGHIHYYELLLITHFVSGKHVVVIRDTTTLVRDSLKKERMMAIAGHELRTPIAVIKSFSQLVKKKLKSAVDEKYLHYLDRIEVKATVLQRLLDNVIDEIKAGENKLTFTNEVVAIDELVSDVAKDMRMVSPKHSFEIVGETNATLYVDKGRLTQVLGNILTNAVKYSPDADVVTIQLHKKTSAVLISITDYGLGIPKTAQKYIFEAFYRSSKHKNAQFPGLGLGLYLSNKIIQYYNGTLRFRSKTGQGTTFTIELPVSQT